MFLSILLFVALALAMLLIIAGAVFVWILVTLASRRRVFGVFGL